MGEDNLTDEYDQNEEAGNDGIQTYQARGHDENEDACDDDYGDEDDMAKLGCMTDESAELSQEKHKDSEKDFRSSFSSVDPSNSSSSEQSIVSDQFVPVRDIAKVKDLTAEASKINDIIKKGKSKLAT